MNVKKLFIPLAIALFAMYSCSTKNEQSEETKQPEVQTASVDTTNILIAQVCQNGKWGYINKDFKMVITPQFDGAMRFNEGLGCVKVGDKWGFVNLKGEFVIQPTYNEPGVFYDGLAKVGNMAGNGNGSSRYFYINKEGKNVFDKLFKFGEDFNNGIAMVKDLDGKQLFITLKGEVVTDGPPLLYNHFKCPIKPYGGDLSKSLVLDKKTGNPVDVKYSKSNYGYVNELGYPLTEAIYCGAGEFWYSYQTPKKYFSTKKEDTISTASAFTEINGTYVRTENVEEGDYAGIKITFKTDAGEEITFDGYNANSKLIPLYFICSDCPSPDATKKSSVGMKHLLKYSVQKTEDGGGIRESKILEAIENAK